MDMQRKVSLTTSKDDWLAIRECYVKSFCRYPLYEYMVPDPGQREAFLRAYLDANYEVTVGSGQGILIKLTVGEGGHKIIGGLVCVPPSSDGCGWAIASDEPYWKAYDKHGLREISAEGLERVKRYEEWENKNIAQKMAATRLPMWNGLFCAMDLEYAAKGLGSDVYQETVRIVGEYWIAKKSQNCAKHPVNLIERARKQRLEDARKNSAAEEKECGMARIFKSLSLKQVQNGCQKARVTPASEGKDATQAYQPATQAQATELTAPLLVAITHSTRASHFHAVNGFRLLVKIPFYDGDRTGGGESAPVFYTHVLVLDPFRSGSGGCLEAALTNQGTALHHGPVNGMSPPADSMPAVG